MLPKKLVTMMLLLSMAAPAVALAQAVPATGEVWRTFTQRLEAGSRITVRLANGQRLHATLIEARDDELVLQPRTRRPVPVQSVRYDAILSVERDDRSGMGAAKAAAIGVASGAGAFLAILLILAAAWD